MKTKISSALILSLLLTACGGSGGGTTPKPTPAQQIDMVADELSSKPGRMRPSRPGAVCDSDDLARAVRYGATPNYEYLVDRCDLIHEWKKQAAIGITQWLAENGYDSPLVTCKVTLLIDRSIGVGSKVAVSRWPDGKFKAVVTLPDFNNIPQGTPEVPLTPGTVLEQAPDHWTLSSYGQPVRIDIDPLRALTLDHEGLNAFWMKFHDKEYTKPIDPHLIKQEVDLDVPCWRDKDQPMAGGYGIMKCLNTTTGKATEGPCKTEQ